MWYHYLSLIFAVAGAYGPVVLSGSHGPLPTAAVLRDGIRGTPWCAPTGLVVG